jgi:hypothetical protein
MLISYSGGIAQRWRTDGGLAHCQVLSAGLRFEAWSFGAVRIRASWSSRPDDAFAADA